MRLVILTGFPLSKTNSLKQDSRMERRFMQEEITEYWNELDRQYLSGTFFLCTEHKNIPVILFI